MTHVDWHPYPKEKPNRTGHFLVCDGYLQRLDDPGIRVDFWMEFENGIWGWLSSYNVLAWAKLPQPYKLEK